MVLTTQLMLSGRVYPGGTGGHMGCGGEVRAQCMKVPRRLMLEIQKISKKAALGVFAELKE